jgi:hypothetical protein
MNERIKQLAAKANFGHMENGEVVYDPRLEKFAELIVQECVEVVKWTPSMFPNDTVIKNIKEHFGVKE